MRGPGKAIGRMGRTGKPDRGVLSNLTEAQREELEAKLKAAVGGDREALVTVLEAVGPLVRARIVPKIGPYMQSSLDADDVMQVTYMEAVTRVDRFSSGGLAGFLAWLAQLAENNLIDAVRAMQSAKRPDPRRRVGGGGGKGGGGREGEDSAVTLVEMLGATSATPSRAAARHEAEGFLEWALKHLPPVYEKVIRGYDLEGKPAAEVAGAIGKSEGAMYMIRARAHDRLKEALGSGSRFFSTPA